MSDVLAAATVEAAGILVRGAVTTGLCEEARGLHGASPTATAALGRALTGALLLASLLKDRQSILLQWRGDGPLGPVVAEGTAGLTVRGYVARSDVDVPSRSGKIDVGGGVGRRGDLVVVKDYGIREPYVSTVGLQTGEIGDDLAYYLLTSEQIPSAVALGVYVRPDYTVAAAGGLLVEALPEADPALVARVAENVGRIDSVTEILRRDTGVEGLFDAALAGISYRTRPVGTPSLWCSCGPDRLEATLVALGPEEVRDILETEGAIRARCAFCRSQWRKETLEGEWQREEGGPAQTPR